MRSTLAPNTAVKAAMRDRGCPAGTREAVSDQPQRAAIVFKVIAEAIAMLGTASQRWVRGRSQPRPVHHVKPHLSAAYNG